MHDCIGRLRDNILDWEDPLPEESLEWSEEISSEAVLLLDVIRDGFVCH